MRVVRLKGGLGNQMFQYAFAKEIERVTGECVKLDYSAYSQNVQDLIRKPRIEKYCLSLEPATEKDLSTVFKYGCLYEGLLPQNKIGKAFNALFNSKYYLERDRAYRPCRDIEKYSYYDGYWQSWRYVDAVFDAVKKDFHPRDCLSVQTQNTIQQVKDVNSVFVGVRKGDYCKEESHYGNFGPDYYLEAMHILEKKICNPVYFIFSNDIDWVKKHLDFGKRAIVYRENDMVIDDFEELQIMINCKHSIMVNSTYHWWGAKMNETPDKVIIAPKRWFADSKPIDIVPPHWITI